MHRILGLSEIKKTLNTGPHIQDVYNGKQIKCFTYETVQNKDVIYYKYLIDSGIT